MRTYSGTFPLSSEVPDRSLSQLCRHTHAYHLVCCCSGAQSAARLRPSWKSCRRAGFANTYSTSSLSLIIGWIFSPVPSLFPAVARQAPRSQVFCKLQYHPCALQEEHPEITIVKIDTTDEELGKLADEEGITVLPTFKFYKDGKEVCGGCRATEGY